MTDSFLTWLSKEINNNIESSSSQVQLAVIEGVFYLVEAQVDSVLNRSLDRLFEQLVMIVQRSFCPRQLGRKAMALVLLLVEKYPQRAAQNKITEDVVGTALDIAREASLGRGESQMMLTVFRGLERLNVSYSLAHGYRGRIAQLVNNDSISQAKCLETFLAQLGLFLTCLYSGDVSNPFESSGASSSDESFLEVTEKMVVLFQKLREGRQDIGCVVARVMPQLLIDFLQVDQAMSLVIGELTQHTQPSHLVANVWVSICNILREGGQDQTVQEWVLMCLNTFSQVQSSVHSVWALTVLFLSASKNTQLRWILPNLLARVQSDDELFALAAMDFFENQNLSDQEKQQFCRAFVSPGNDAAILTALREHVEGKVDSTSSEELGK
eukprot:TRINITY_DN9317_c0_g1_i1.p1 TRINITY_DN9317_c0_g1~~TRINITY_DN9317_c0_g1_i1.p1  ORF type:complete len:422 (+),score=121.17 TRINITY_DN9317_c0_g1_i1:120-1268(+)